MDQDQFLTLLNKEIQGKLTPEEKLLFEKLIIDNPDHQLLYHFIKNRQGIPSSTIEKTEMAFDQLWKKLEDSTPENIPVRSRIKKRYLFYLVAASIAIFFFVGMWRYSSHQEVVEYKMSYSSNKGEKRIISLPDGSTVWLNGDSKLYLATDFNKKERRVKLVGEGFFAVAKDKKHPFIVSCKDSEVKVLGTKFNIRAYQDENKTQTSLVEGAIELKSQNSDETYRMVPGEKLTIAHNLIGPKFSDKSSTNTIKRTALIVQDGEKMPSEALWLENKLSFEADPMNIVASKIGKWYNRNIVIDNTELEKTTFTGTMENYSLEMVLKTILLANPKLHIREENESIILY
ncbi:MAG: FecR domain-containing protein [Sphingobacterium sp.]|jgi:ferric-dicitrate binding protein FerR (iron transport regulator)|uniref:FecR family protein n=1 Tax=Sphingobacterium sp. TaxID=341027 RepID=UPI00281B09E4|nr:FecR domain-containing protein [Sphingobacterium sp.]MDR0265437.1 FecR domain-containing protein [Sphingobacterium sp.]